MSEDTKPVRFRWLNGWEASNDEWNRVDEILAARGWASLNRNTTRILLAELEDKIAFIVLQSVPYVGPLFVPPSMRGGELAEELVTRMYEFMASVGIRGWVATAESRFAAKFCEDRGMQRLDLPVYVMPQFGGIQLDSNDAIR